MKRLNILIIILIVLGIGGYYGWRSAQKKSSSNQASGSSSPAGTQATQTNDSQPKQPVDPTEDGKYLVIKEWGVRFPLDRDISDAYYRYVDDETVELTTKSVDNIQKCKDTKTMPFERSLKGGDIGATTVDTFLAQNPNALTRIGDYYYLFFPGSLSCASSDDSSSQRLLSTVRDMFTQDTRKLEALSGG